MIWDEYDVGQFSEEAFKKRMLEILGSDDPVVSVVTKMEKIEEMKKVFQPSKKTGLEDEIKMILVINDDQGELEKKLGTKIVINASLANGQLKRVVKHKTTFGSPLSLINKDAKISNISK